MTSSPQSAVFWTDPNNHDWMQSELRAGRVRQGWGFAGCQLFEHGSQTPYERWAENYRAGILRSWRVEVTDDEARTRYRILMRMLQLRPGDQLVIPKMPEEGWMTLAKVRNSYTFDDSHFGKRPFYKGNHSDFIHIIDVDPGTMAEVRRRSSCDAEYVASNWRNYRQAITFARDPAFRSAIDRLFAAHLES